MSDVEKDAKRQFAKSIGDRNATGVASAKPTVITGSEANDVDDLVQETVARAIAHSGHFQRGTELRSGLFTIMRDTFCTKQDLQAGAAGRWRR